MPDIELKLFLVQQAPITTSFTIQIVLLDIKEVKSSTNFGTPKGKQFLRTLVR